MEHLEEGIKEEIKKLLSSSKNNGLSSEKMKVVAEQMRNLQDYFNQVHEEIKAILTDTMNQNINQQSWQSINMQLQDVYQQIRQAQPSDKWLWQCNGHRLTHHKHSDGQKLIMEATNEGKNCIRLFT